MSTPPRIKRQLEEDRKRNQEGTLLSWTEVKHPPTKFPKGSLTIGLIRLEDGSKVFGQLICKTEPRIGMNLKSRMRLSHVTAEKLRVYQTCFEEVVSVEEKKEEFPGYILALYGPSGVGKNTIRTKLVTQTPGAVTVPIISTREDDVTERKHIFMNEEKFLTKMNAGEVISALCESDHRYGYLVSDIEEILKKGKTPVVIAEKGILQGLSSHFGRRSILSFGLLPPGKSKRTMLSNLLHRLRSRDTDTDRAIEHHILRAKTEIAYCEECTDMFDHVIVNENIDDTVEGVLKQIGRLAN